MSQSVPMTPAGFQAAQEELAHLKSVVRPQVVQDIAEARAHGDISENAEYDAAKERQAFVEARIRELEVKLSRAQIIDTTKLSGDKVMFGATVTVIDVETEAEQTWTIVGEDEANLKEHKLNVHSPLARALVGKNLGDLVEIQTPKGVRECEIVKVSFS